MLELGSQSLGKKLWSWKIRYQKSWKSTNFSLISLYDIVADMVVSKIVQF